MASIKVKLTKDEMLLASLTGLNRKLTSFYDNYKELSGMSKADYISFDLDIYPAAAELAVAKILNKYWQGATQHSSKDVDKYQVRLTLHPKGRLIIREKDKPEDTFVHVRRLDLDTYEIIGHIKGSDGMKPEFFKDPTKTGRPPAWFVPDNKLHRFRKNVSS